LHRRYYELIRLPYFRHLNFDYVLYHVTGSHYLPKVRLSHVHSASFNACHIWTHSPLQE